MVKPACNPLALYLHVPFCGHICPFCAFSVRLDAPGKHKAYLDGLKLEVEILKGQFDLDFKGLKSIYFGGGTPSRLTIPEMEGLVAWLQSLEGFSLGSVPSKSFSIEMNPEDVTLDYARSLKDLGFNRVSLGVQSFSDKNLKLMERKHCAGDNHKAIDILAQAGFTNINLDLLCGVPNQTLKEVTEDLEIFAGYQPQHLSFYLLTMEERAKVSKRKLWLDWEQAEEELLTQIYLQGVGYLESHGLPQYEVSNFAQRGFESAQNLSNWAGEDYLGLGQSAHSMINKRRFGCENSWAKYHKKLKAGQLPWSYNEGLNELEIAEESVMIGLRSPKGLAKIQLEKWAEAGLIQISPANWKQLESEGLAGETQSHRALTLKGLLLADELTAWLLSR